MDRAPSTLTGIEKCPTGIQGLDEITAGGLPKGRPTLVCGGAGCGKTLLGMEFLIHGALEYNEPGVFVTFEESPPELTKNVASLGVDLNALVAEKKLAVKHIQLWRHDVEVAGEYDLEGLFIQLGNAVDAVGAKRIVLDTIETLFGTFPDGPVLRSELQRLFRWLKERGLTAIITGERGEKTYTRHGLEEYVADCVIVLDHRIVDQIATRRVRIVKYRGSVHGPDEYPFLIDEQGISVLPITSLDLKHSVSSERVPTGVACLDTMLGDSGGYYRGSSVLVSGTAGTGKSSLAASFVSAACKRGERCLYFAFEESAAQIARNMLSIGIDLQPAIDAGMLQIVPSRSTACGLELHLATIHRAVTQFHPHIVVVDPISNLISIGTPLEVKSMLTRLIDFLKSRQITAFFTSLNHGGGPLEATDAEISSIADTWISLRDVESSGERNRQLHLLKSRGMAHSNQMREFFLTSAGIELRDAYLGPGGVLTGTARQVQESGERAAALVRAHEVERLRRDLERKREVLEARIAALRAESAAEMSEAEALVSQAERSEAQLGADRTARGESRKGDARKGERA